MEVRNLLRNLGINFDLRLENDQPERSSNLVEATELQEMEEEDERIGEAYLRTAMEEEIVEFLFNEEETIVD